MLSRRNFLKLLPLLLLPANSRIRKLRRRFGENSTNNPNHPNIIIFLFDTLSARHISLYGYPRDTMPNLARFAEKSIIYHQHHAGGNWTPTGAASLLTGTYPWTHRCFTLYAKILDEFSDKNIFSVTKEQLKSVGYTQNFLVKNMFYLFRNSIDFVIPMEEGGVYNNRPEGTFFEEDYLNSHWAQDIIQGTWEFPASSPFFSLFYQLYFVVKHRKLSKQYQNLYPQGLPYILPGVFLNPEQISSFIKSQTYKLASPTLHYYHFFPPHNPYVPSERFQNKFQDNWSSPEKPTHVFATHDASHKDLNYSRLHYDRYIANVDAEFGAIIDFLDESGQMENSYIIFTSDHGESFERGIWRHTTKVLYEPLIHVPLLIHKPGQKEREDIFTPTSAVDILPTICHITSQTIPNWAEGETLPGFRNAPPDLQRPIFSVEAKENSKFAPLKIGTISMIQWPYKLIHYFGYEKLPYHFELYNLEDDAEELDDLYNKNPDIAGPMTQRLLTKIDDVNKSFSNES